MENLVPMRHPTPLSEQLGLTGNGKTTDTIEDHTHPDGGQTRADTTTCIDCGQPCTPGWPDIGPWCTVCDPEGIDAWTTHQWAELEANARRLDRSEAAHALRVRAGHQRRQRHHTRTAVMR